MVSSAVRFMRPFWRSSAVLRRTAVLALVPLCALAASSATPTPPATHSLIGAYLSGNAAIMRNDIVAAAHYVTQVYAPTNTDVAYGERALSALLSAGKMPEAFAVAERILQQQPENFPAQLTLAVRDARENNYAAALKHLAEDTPLRLAQVIRHWLLYGNAEGAARTAYIKKLIDMARSAGNNDGAIVLYHAALMSAVDGDITQARALLQPLLNRDNTSLQRVSMRAVDFDVLLKQPDQAKLLLDEAVLRTNNPLLRARASLLKQNTLLTPESINIQSGMAEALLTGAAVFARETPDTPRNLLYAQACIALAHYLAPQMPAVQFLRAELAADETGIDQPSTLAQFEALHADPIYGAYAIIRQAAVLHNANRSDEALALLSSKKVATQSFMLLSTQGDILRDLHRYTDAIDVYSRAIAAATADGYTKTDSIVYARGTAYERLGQWDKAEADLRAALKNQPNNPQILNYLGYSLADRGANLAEAEELLQRAARAEPDAGYIIDSLGWVQFKRGNYAMAVKVLEQAISLTAGDMTVHEHLGDAYDKVGRTREASFEWAHALSFAEQEADKVRLQQKLRAFTDAQTPHGQGE